MTSKPAIAPAKSGLYSRVLRRMWNDARFRRLTAPQPNAQTLFIRLLSGPELTVIPGVFPAWEAGLAQALGWPLEGFRKAFGEVFREGLAEADWEAGLVFVPKALKHNPPASPNVVISWGTHWDLLPECNLKVKAYWTLKAFAEGLGKAFGEAFAKGIANPSPNQEQEQDQLKQPPPLSPPSRGGPDEPPATAKPKGTPKGTRLAPDWKPRPEELAELTAKGVDATRIIAEFVDYWIAVPGQKGLKLDWDATFRNNLRRIEKFGELAPKSAGGRPSWGPPKQPGTPPRPKPSVPASAFGDRPGWMDPE